MSNINLTPDSTILQQLDGQWQKFALMIIWKLKGTEKVTITAEDMRRCTESAPPGGWVLYTHGHSDSIDFQAIGMEAAERLAAHDQTQKGTA